MCDVVLMEDLLIDDEEVRQGEAEEDTENHDEL